MAVDVPAEGGETVVAEEPVEVVEKPKGPRAQIPPPATLMAPDRPGKVPTGAVVEVTRWGGAAE
eukprot:11966589-Alexandrium_andersonii.AAC.1